MVEFKKVTKLPNFSHQLDNKILYSEHNEDIEVNYKSTYTLKYVIEGSKCYNLNNKDIHVSSGQYLILNDNNINTKAFQGTKGFSLFLSHQLISEIYNNLYSNSNYSLDFFEFPQSSYNSEVGNQLYKTIFLFNNNPSVFKLQMHDLFIKLSEVVIKEQVDLEKRFSELKIIKYNTKKEIFKHVISTKEFINDNFNLKVTLEKLSTSIGVSKYYLHRLFSEVTGNTPLEYLTFVRLKNAQQQLEHSKKSVFEIAIDCGFDNTPYFSNIFKSYFGISPTTYRRNKISKIL
ncbi:conserved hypothetical protein [Tenacibaculum litoreum]|uniref:helix-turn-helix transcriptional regulator n=1 Tax=Tenacibaculum litoreum TaxID=321269 RepID=UPI0038932A98